MRARFTIAAPAWGRARAYAEATNRTPSELICEALDQIQARYPKTPRCNETCEERVMARILANLAPRVPAGTFGVQLGKARMASGGREGGAS